MPVCPCPCPRLRISLGLKPLKVDGSDQQSQDVKRQEELHRRKEKEKMPKMIISIIFRPSQELLPGRAGTQKRT
jgi:hypothetical protein